MKKVRLICILAFLLVLSALTLTACSGEDMGEMLTPTVAIVNPAKTQSSISFDILETDHLNSGSVTKIELIQGDNDPIVAEDVKVREFNGLLSNTKYTVKVSYTYTIGEGEKIEQTKTVVKSIDITTEAKEEPSISIINISKTESKIGFETLEVDKDKIGQISKIELLNGSNAPILLTDLTKREFTDLHDDTKYTVKVTYSYDLNDGAGEKELTATSDVYTEKEHKEVPMVFLVNPVFTTNSVGFDILEIDRDNIGQVSKIELLHGNDTPVLLNDLTKREFSNLLSDNRYTVKVTYTYDIGDGAQTIVSTLDIKTEKEKAPELYILGSLSDQTIIYFEILELDKNDIGEISKIELYENGALIHTEYDTDARIFTGLNANTLYTVKVTYVYDFGNGNGEQTEVVSMDIATLSKLEPEVYLDVYSVSSSYVSFELEIIDIDDVGCNIEKIELLSNGSVVQTAANSSVREFSGLMYNSKYVIKVTYSYDLGDGNGKITDYETLEFKTNMEEIPNWSSRYDVRITWSGETLDVATTSWSSFAGAPWGVVEACVKSGSTSGFGTIIDTAVLERNAFIKETYGVTVNWINASRYGNANDLETAIASGKNWDIYMPRILFDQELVASGNLYDMRNRGFINFNQPYYNANSVDTYTAKGHTFFVTGDFSFIDKEIASVLWFNKDLLGDAQATADLYKAVKDGEWTWNMLINLANGAYSDDGDGILDEMDSFGLSLSNINNLYYFFGLSTTGVNQFTGEWELTLDDASINDVISAIISANTSKWVRSAWGGAWSSNAGSAFQQNRLLFYNEVVQHTNITSSVHSGVVPFPMLSEMQGRYYVPANSQQTVLMCIPKNTQDREMSDYFLDVLGWTGDKFLMEGYLDYKSLYVDSDDEMEMLTDYIFPNIVYDSGVAVGWGSVMNDVLSSAHAGNVNNFRGVYETAAPQAQATIDAWNLAWGSYTDA